MTWISLLRGINLAGRRSLSMNDLKRLYQELGFDRVRSYVASGNLVFDAPANKPAKLAALIEKAIARQSGHDLTVLVKTGKDLARICAANPFLGRSTIDPQFLHATFLATAPGGSTLKNVRLPLQGKEAVEQVRDVLYLYCPNGYGRTRINNTYFEKLFSTRATTRNWRTVMALEAMTRDD